MLIAQHTKSQPTVIDDFAALKQTVNGKPLIYLDNAATTQKPQCVIDAINHYYQFDNANVHRGVHTLSERATAAYEVTRQKVSAFINAKYDHEVIFTRGTTDAINLIAQCFSRAELKAGDEIIISATEHHANIVPWQIACQQTGAQLKIIPVNNDGSLDIDVYCQLLSDKTKLVAVVHVSNVLGIVNPVKQMIAMAHQHGVPVLLDGAQAIAHFAVDVQELDCDFYAFSAHKLYGPTGIGVLYGKTQWLNRLPPYQGGGEMIKRVTFAHTEYNDLPYKFEAGTPNIAGVIGLAAAIDYLNAIGMDWVWQHSCDVVQYAMQQLQQIPELMVLGQAANKIAVIAFTLGRYHPHDIATILDHDGIAIRAGHHCAMPLMDYFSLPATARASFAIYNTYDDVDRLVAALKKVKNIL